jgi:alkanesulfonate monooxygenase SsuD/methylene tetrahydromethanopterin reductase-like flavin-dependent oxidoreductase (luciferase family)
MRRTAEHGDGWITLYHQPDDDARADFERLRDYAEEAGRDRADIGVDVWVSMGQLSPADWRREVEGWQEIGVSHITLNTAFDVSHHHRIDGRSLDAHIDAASRYMDAVNDLL